VPIRQKQPLIVSRSGAITAVRLSSALTRRVGSPEWKTGGGCFEWFMRQAVR
jgi:hypothetical protein